MKSNSTKMLMSIACGLTINVSLGAMADESGGYVIPADELGKFMENQETQEFSEGNQETVEKKEGDSAGMYMFRLFKSRIERSGKEFNTISDRFQGKHESGDESGAQ